MAETEMLVSVDIETSGPSPSTGSMLSLGACLVDDPAISLYLELIPDADLPWDEGAARIHQLDRARLERDGIAPEAAMLALSDWLERSCAGLRPVFVGFNAPFDWMFVSDYFWRHLGRNPFGVSALDLKSYYMGREGVAAWELTRRVHIDQRLGLPPDHNHNALDDASGQARLAQVLLSREEN
ncbi:MAG TPA: 3'-5' exonuclease [Candidatus Limnocylindrales bacterium]|nr:3'-5' exonuclease [Candidatus Limnocylindrales bacterium]